MKAPSPKKRAVLAAPSLRAWVRLLEVQKLVLSELRGGLEPNVSLSRFDLLEQLAREDGQTLASLSRRMLVTAGNLTGLVDRAERDGLVVRRSHASDRRATRVFLTDEGRSRYRGALSLHNGHVERIFGCLSRKDQRTLADMLGTLRTSLREKDENA